MIKSFLKKWIVPPGFSGLIVKIIKHIEYIRSTKSSDAEKICCDVLRGRHSGNRCFIVGSGSSIKGQNLKWLKGEIVISVSNTFVHPDFKIIKPAYHVLPPLLKSHGMLYEESKFVEWLKAMESAIGCAEMIMHVNDRDLVDKNELFKERVIHWVEYSESWDCDFDTAIDLSSLPPIWSVSELAITAAVYMGFDNVYLLGIDHDWFNGKHVYFYDHTKEHMLRPQESKLDYIDSEFQMIRHAKIFRKYKYLYSINKNIYNANADPNHYLDVFPKVDYNTLFG